MRYDNTLELIGNTPLVKINALNPHKHISIYAKLEGSNPGGSIKDRIALRMIEGAEREGRLTGAKTIIEPTSGNTGIGLALVAAAKGYNIEIVMSSAASIERRRTMEALGAKVILSPAEKGTDGAISLARTMVQRSPQKYVMLDQFSNPLNQRAHYENTAPEIVQDVPECSHLVATLGTSGTLMGISAALKEHREDITVTAIEPYPRHRIQGLKNLREATVPPLFDEYRIDERMHVNDEKAFEYARKLAQHEGLFVGMSSGAALAGALQLAERLKNAGQEATIVTIFPDRAEKYLSTTLFGRDTMGLKLHNTLSGQMEEFVGLQKGSASIYTCGPTVYDYAHIGNFRSYVFADILKRYLAFKGYCVTHVMNITDVDDKTIKYSQKMGKAFSEYTQYYTDAFFEDFRNLHMQMPDETPSATGTINDMVELVKTLLDKGYAYKSDDGSVYFSIATFPEYGKLSKTQINQLKAGARVSQDEYDKEDAADFVLWKAYSEEDGDVYWDTELGPGRPGWHIECSAMSTKYLGRNFDIHTGGIDLVFPHHENEIAQSEAATGSTMANYWLHCEHLQVEGRKMAKSFGNFYRLRDIIEKGYSYQAVRYVLATTHYQQQLNFTFEGLKAAEQALQRISDFITKLREVKNNKSTEGVKSLIRDTRQRFEENMDDNLNTSAALASIFEFMRRINKLLADERIGESDAQEILSFLQECDSVLGILEWKEEELDPEYEKLIKEREEARANKDFKRADEIREYLREQGIILEDTKEGTRWKKQH